MERVKDETQLDGQGYLLEIWQKRNDIWLNEQMIYVQPIIHPGGGVLVV